MTTSYWEMVATLVNRGVLHAELFFDHTGEDIVTWERCKPWITARAPTSGPPTSTSSSAWCRSPRVPRAPQRRAREARAGREACGPGQARGAGPEDRAQAVALTMASTFGRLFGVTTFGESHGAGGGRGGGRHAAGDRGRRRAASSASSTGAARDRARSPRSARRATRVEILSGVFEGVSLGTPIAMLVRNTDPRPQDYDALQGRVPAGARRPRVLREVRRARPSRGRPLIGARDGGPGGGRRARALALAHGAA